MADFRSRANRLADLAAGKARGLASLAARKTKNVSRIAKLNVDIATERDCIKRNYLEIGKLYYETHREDPESYFLQLCQEIDLALETIAGKEAEIVRLKTENHEGKDGPAIEVEITEEPEAPAETNAAEAAPSHEE